MMKIIGMAAVLACTMLQAAACRADEAGKDEMGNGKELIVVAHRGGADLGPENSLGCIRKGIAAGAGWVEIDVHLSADGEIVVCHDPSVDRTTDGKGQISGMTYPELRKLRLLDGEGRPTDEHLPTLDEVLDLTKGRVVLLIEIKHSKHSLPGIEKACVDCISAPTRADEPSCPDRSSSMRGLHPPPWSREGRGHPVLRGRRAGQGA